VIVSDGGSSSTSTTEPTPTTDPASATTVEPTTTVASTVASTASSTTAQSTTESPTTDQSTTSETTEPTTTPTSTQPDPYLAAVWPSPSSDRRFTDPVDAAGRFAIEFVGFDQPVVGPFREGDGRSGEVEIRPVDVGPSTVIFVRKLGPDDSWWIIGAATGNITIDEPGALDAVSSPLTVSGRALAFEGHVDLELRADDGNNPVLSGYVIGGGTANEPFTAEFTFDPPQADAGAIVAYTRSEEDGRIWEAAVTRVQFNR